MISIMFLRCIVTPQHTKQCQNSLIEICTLSFLLLLFFKTDGFNIYIMIIYIYDILACKFGFLASMMMCKRVFYNRDDSFFVHR